MPKRMPTSLAALPIGSSPLGKASLRGVHVPVFADQFAVVPYHPASMTMYSIPKGA